MSDASDKFKFDASIEDRLVLFRTFSTATRCSSCGTGPVDTTDAVKLITFGKAWDLFKLDDFSELSQAELLKKIQIDGGARLSVTLNANILRFTIETLLTRSYMLAAFTPIIDLVPKLLNIAAETETKIPGRSDGVVQDKQFTFSFQELAAITNILLGFKPCENKFQLADGKLVEHGVPTDYPKTIAEFDIFYRLIQELSVLPLLLGKESIAKFDGEKEYVLDTETANYLKTLVVNRSMNINFPAHKLAGIIEKLGS